MQSRFDHDNMALVSRSGGKNAMLYDDKGLPSVMVQIPRFDLADVMDGAPREPHPMFIVNGKVARRVWFSKFLNTVHEGRGYSVGGVVPAYYVTRDTAKAYCEAKGEGWHLASNAEYAGISLWCKANGFQPHGNNWCGRDVNHKWETAEKDPNYLWPYATNWNNTALYQRDSDGYYMHIGLTKTGTGPVTWAHDGTSDGIYDLNGTQWEVMSGLRMLNGEINIIPNNNSALQLDESRGSSQWKAILQNGTLVAPGTASTLKFNGVNPGSSDTVDGGMGAMKLDIVRTNAAYTGGDVDDYYKYYANTFESFKAADGVTVPTIAKALGLFPNDATGYEGDYIYARNYGERLPLRGGYWTHAAGAGVFCLDFTPARAWSVVRGGFRAAYIDPLDLEDY